MAFHSTLVKWIIATFLVGGGVTGAVLGSINSKGIDKSSISRKIENSEVQGGNLDAMEGQNPPLSAGTAASEDSGKAEPKGGEPQLDRGPEIKPQESGTQVSEEVVPSSLENKGSESLYISQSDTVSSPEEVSALTKQNQDLGPQVPKLPADEPILEEQIPPEREEDFEEPAESEENVDEDRDWTNTNWFVTKWGVSDNDLDGSAWMYRECTPNISGGELKLECAWNGEVSQMVELHLYLSSDEDLKGKNWANLVELTFSGKVGKLATLDLIFSDKLDRVIQVFIYRRGGV